MKAQTKKKARKKIKVVAPLPPRQQATRRISDTVLMRMLDEHMADSLSDIADVYQRLSTQLGFKTMKFQEHVRVSSSISLNDRAFDLASAISSWRKACDKRGMDSRVPMYVVADGLSVSSIMWKVRMRRACVRAHLRACLCVWSLFRKRCDPQEVVRSISALSACCPKPK